MKHCPCKRRGNRWFIVQAFGTLSTSEGGACFRKFAYIIKLRPMLRDSGEWFVSLVKYFFILFFLWRHFFILPQIYLHILYVYPYNIFHTVALNAFTRDNICKRLFFLRRDAALGFNKTGHFSGDHLGISKEICRWLKKSTLINLPRSRHFLFMQLFSDLQEYLQMINEDIPVLHKTIQHKQNIKLYT